jgi:16S rRNA (guanine527-N7)-methyltransferase
MQPIIKSAPMSSNSAAQSVADLPYVSRETFLRLEKFVQLLIKWNKAINLIGKADEEEIWHRHILDSAQLYPLLSTPDALITDFGSGAGFPGVILSLLGAREVHLVESDQRKTAFLREAARLSEHKLLFHNDRIETLSPWKSDIITARALAPLPKLLQWVNPFFTPATQALFLKGKNLHMELEQAQSDWQFTHQLHPSCTASDSWIIEIHALAEKRE